MNQEFSGIQIKAIASCVPKRLIANDSFGDILSPKELRVFEKTVGIKERRWANEGVTACDLGFKAASDLLESYDVKKEDISCLIFVSQTPDYKIPFTSNILQDRLQLRQEILCLDINAGCAGFIQGLSTSFALAKSLKKEGKVLFIIAETLSKILSEKDRSTTMLFGDGASAILIENTDNDEIKSFFNFFSDGAHADAIAIPDGGFRNTVSVTSFDNVVDHSGNVRNRLNLKMDGPKVFDFTLREIAPSIELLLLQSNVDKDDLDYFLLHQSNQFIIKQIASKLGVSADKMLMNISEFGNTSGVSIPLLISSNIEKLKSKSYVAMSGYGSGLNWGNCIINLAETKLFEIKTY